MSNLKLEIAFWDYDRTRALADGTVKIPGIDASFRSAPIVTQIFECIGGRMSRRKREMLDAVLRYHFEQGITDRRYSLRDLFVSDMLDT